MSHDKVITVLGATGTQGGAVVRALLTGGDFTVRAVTRNAASPKAQALARLGAHVVEAALTDEGSLRRAFDGAYGAFLVTPYWEHRSPARELAEVEPHQRGPGNRLRHVVWSTLEDTREVIAADDDRMPVIGDGYRVPHFDVKGGAGDALFAKSGPSIRRQTSRRGRGWRNNSLTTASAKRDLPSWSTAGSMRRTVSWRSAVPHPLATLLIFFE